MADWVRREHGKGEIDRAGRFLVPWWQGTHVPSAEELGNAYSIVENWRTCHAYPLNTFQVNLRSRARRIEPEALVAQRLKRFTSVMNKLTREPKMALTQMHDLGGCRAIMSNVDAVENLAGLYRGQETELFQSEGTLKVYDYLNTPKPDGYRGIHIVGRYSARHVAHEDWNGQRIEVQIRSQLQHAFATAVETVTTFTRTPLKFGGGPEEWRRFFSLMGSALALREGTTPVANTPRAGKALTRNLRRAAKTLDVKRRLRTWATALRAIPRRHVTGANWLLMVLDVEKNTVSVTGFVEPQKAREALTRQEQRLGIGDRFDAVLVWVPSARHLRAAYPNYYADTTEFISALDDALKGSL